LLQALNDAASTTLHRPTTRRSLEIANVSKPKKKDSSVWSLFDNANFRARDLAVGDYLRFYPQCGEGVPMVFKVTQIYDAAVMWRRKPAVTNAMDRVRLEHMGNSADTRVNIAKYLEIAAAWHRLDVPK
jgi:hypothetical protein